MSATFIYVTAANRDSALRIGRDLVERRLVACANVIDGATSLYWWDGKLQEEAEAILIAKTLPEQVTAVTDRILEIHDYSCPCVVALPVSGGNPAFFDWIAAQVTPPVV